MKQENIVALCGIDDQKLAAAKQQFPEAKIYNDFRRLVDQKDIDAIVVATPDHTHAVAAVAALQSGRHLYCEKPMARTISEVRVAGRRQCPAHTTRRALRIPRARHSTARDADVVSWRKASDLRA
ncbi:MAG: hypothetical protein EXS36_17015 [Pedosphaera sp.]|nr:hypothetical protein [Pedosphaera sp.]